MNIFKKINRTLLVGLATVFPILATCYLLYWAAFSFEHFLGQVLRIVLPDHVYIPGLGIFLGILLLFMVGIMMRAWFIRNIVEKFENAIFKIPLIKSIYGSIRELVTFVTTGQEKGPKQVVSVTLGETGAEVIGFMTRTDLGSLSKNLGKNLVAVYLPMSYQIGGYTVLIPKEQVKPLDIPLDKAMRFVISAGVIERSSAAKQDIRPL